MEGRRNSTVCAWISLVNLCVYTYDLIVALKNSFGAL